METLHGLAAHPIGRGVITGLLGAMLIDYGAFKSWKSSQDALSYDWRLAAWRWLQGAVTGAVAGAGLEAAL